MKGQLTIEFMFAAAAYLAFIFVLIHENNATLQKLTDTARDPIYTANAQYISVLYSIKELNNPNTAYIIERTNCTISETSVICGTTEKRFMVPIYIRRDGGAIGKEIV